MPKHNHPVGAISLLLAGSFREETVRQVRFADPGWMVIKPAGLDHEDVFGPTGAVMLSIEEPPEGGDLSHLWNQVMADYRWLPVGRSTGRLVSYAKSCPQDRGLMEEMLLAILWDVETIRGTASIQETFPWLQRAVECIESCFCESLSLTDLANVVGVHPVYLGKRLQDHFGCTVSEHIHKRRVQRALTQLSAGVQVGEVAQALGYADQSHFVRWFKRWMGCPPSELRQISSVHL